MGNIFREPIRGIDKYAVIGTIDLRNSNLLPSSTTLALLLLPPGILWSNVILISALDRFEQIAQLKVGGSIHTTS